MEKVTYTVFDNKKAGQILQNWFPLNLQLVAANELWNTLAKIFKWQHIAAKQRNYRSFACINLSWQMNLSIYTYHIYVYKLLYELFFIYIHIHTYIFI